jgi:ABC-type polysaccharide/polyol phosphate export permease
LYYPTVVGLTLLYMGYAFFKANEERFADLT